MLTQFTSSTAGCKAACPWEESERHSKAGGKERQAAAAQYSTYSDVGPDVGGGDYGTPRRPVRCESLNRQQTGYPGHRSNLHLPPPWPHVNLPAERCY